MKPSIDETLLARLRQVALERLEGRDPAHDGLHVLRVAATGRTIARAEKAEVSVVVAASLLHELVNYPKGDPRSHLSGDEAAVSARAVLSDCGVGPEASDAVCYAIRVHAFSRGIVPDTLEARVVQDADRLDAVGAIGIARCFATCQAMGRPFYDDGDPFCSRRPPDDARFGVDHFYTKLLKIPERMHTATARELVRGRLAFMESFLSVLASELGER